MEGRLAGDGASPHASAEFTHGSEGQHFVADDGETFGVRPRWE
jgi:hypothetical protein